MKARKVFENLDFKRGQSISSALNIGIKSIITKKLIDAFADEYWYFKVKDNGNNVIFKSEGLENPRSSYVSDIEMSFDLIQMKLIVKITVFGNNTGRVEKDTKEIEVNEDSNFEDIVYEIREASDEVADTVYQEENYNEEDDFEDYDEDYENY